MIQIRIELVHSFGVELQRTSGHRAVDVHGKESNPLLLFELLDPVKITSSSGRMANDGTIACRSRRPCR